MASNLRVDSIVPATGTNVSIGTATGGVNIPGVLTYEDVTNVDSVGVVTARTDINLGDSIIHIGDTNTKIRFPAADTVSVETAGSERLRITSGGQVNIGGDYTQTTYPFSVLGSTGGNNQINIVQRLKYSGDSNQYNTGTVIAFTNTNTNANAYSYIGARIDSGSSGANANALIFATNATNTAPTEKLRIGSAGQIGIAGANYGSSGQVLTSQGSGSAVTWATPSSGGAVLQVKSTTRSNQIDVSVNIDVDYGSFGDIVAVTITPTSSSNKVLITYTVSGSGDNGVHGVTTIKRAISGGSTSYPALGDSASGYHRASTGTRFVGGNNFNIATQSFTFLDSPSTTSAITYTIVGATEGANTWHINSNGENSSGHTWSTRFCTTVTAMEVTP